MTTSSRRPLQGFGQQLGRLQRLAQPYFLPVEESRSWQFLLLVVALLVVVVGVAEVAWRVVTGSISWARPGGFPYADGIERIVGYGLSAFRLKTGRKALRWLIRLMARGSAALCKE